MAQGDAVTVITAGVNAAASITYQPASGVHVKILSVGGTLTGAGVPNDNPDVTVNYYNGSNASAVAGENSNKILSNLNMPINNTDYIQLTNTAAGTAILSIGGIQIK